MALRTPPLDERHAAAGAKTTEFGGWEMPVHFGSIREEHAAVRESLGKFDVSHMGQLHVFGPDAVALTDRLVTADITSLSPGRARYTPVTDAEGVILDDVVVYRRESGVLVVPNAGHDEEMATRWDAHCEEWDLNVEVQNATESYGMLAVQGPDAEDTLADAGEESLRDLSRFGHADATVAGIDCLVARTGYTGEDGYELLAPAAEFETVWDAFDCQPCGLGARDTLRLEMGYLLSGQEFDAESNPRTPYEAGIGWTVALDSEFVGRDALADATNPEETLTGIRLAERGVPRHGYDVTDEDGYLLGTVTSGTVSPTLNTPIALAYLPADLDVGADVGVVVRGDRKRGTVVETPFLEDY